MRFWFFFGAIGGLGACDHVFVKTHDQHLSMDGKIERIDYDLSNFCIKTFNIGSATGIYRDGRIDLFTRGGNFSMTSQNSTESNVTFRSDELQINGAELIDSRIYSNGLTSEIFCIGSFSVKLEFGQNISSEEA